jgi:hypothetical protein
MLTEIWRLPFMLVGWLAIVLHIENMLKTYFFMIVMQLALSTTCAGS